MKLLVKHTVATIFIATFLTALASSAHDVRAISNSAQAHHLNRPINQWEISVCPYSVSLLNYVLINKKHTGPGNPCGSISIDSSEIDTWVVTPFDGLRSPILVCAESSVPPGWVVNWIGHDTLLCGADPRDISAQNVKLILKPSAVKPAPQPPSSPSQPVPPAPPPVVNFLGKDKLCAGEEMRKTEALLSENGKYVFVFQQDNNLAIYEIGSTWALWGAGTRRAADRLVMQHDGNLVLYRGVIAVWDSHRQAGPGACLVMQNDGNLVIYQNNRPVWATRTAKNQR